MNREVEGRNVGIAFVYEESGFFVMEFGTVRQRFLISDDWIGRLQMRVQLLLKADTKMATENVAQFTYEGETFALDGLPVARCKWVAN